MAERRRYTKRQKVTAVIAAEMTTAAAAAEQTGIPRRTIGYWMDDPSFAVYRQKTREDLAEGSLSLAHEVLGVIRSKIDQFEPRDLSILWGVLTDKAQLLAGHATERTEHRELEAGLQDHEREALREAIEHELAERMT